ncbi:DUF134 domain-containing protein [Candidatus Dependentiae bacterium]|nr:DUF134 domain-containing protein [Candidatus Dependentiae bacterium]
MVRPFKKRFLQSTPNATYYKPKGIPLRNLTEIILQPDEIESIKLKYVDNLDQIDAAEQMNISQSTFQRILASANKKIADALINGKAIKLINFK